MTKLEIITQAIESRKTISFEYNKDGKVKGKRIGNPHAIFIHQSTDNIIVDIYQTDGVSDTKQRIPDWRPFLFDYIENTEISDDSFEIAIGYDSNPSSGKYNKAICKVK